MLWQAATEAQNPLHPPTLGAVGPNGPSLGTVVVRRVIESERGLICHTDRRSAKKVGQSRANSGQKSASVRQPFYLVDLPHTTSQADTT
jgi:hypothetical protein